MKLILSLLFALVTLTSVALADAKPNIVLIFIDDMGYGDIGPFGSDNPTPHLDRMAAEGMKLTDFYVTSTACTPSRAALMTGCNADRIGMGDSVVFPADKRGLNPDEITIAEILKRAGYATGCFGKWHLGDQPEFMPLAHGFDTYEGIPYSNDMWVQGSPKRNYPPLAWIKQDKPVAHIPDAESQARITDGITEAVVNFIKQHKDGPFFAYVPHSAVHAPFMVTPERLIAAGGDVMRALISEIDHSTGRILETLKSLGIDDNTLVLFTNDNGGGGKTSSGPLRGGKFGPAYEGHMRVATLARWPGKIPAGSVTSEIATTADLFPTLANLAGQPVPTDRIIDGRDISDILLGKKDAKSPHETLFYENGGIRQGQWKLVRYRNKAETTTELYDLQSDLGERTNLASKHPDKVKAMTAQLDEHWTQLKQSTRPAAFVDQPKPLLSQPGTLPTLAAFLGDPPKPIASPTTRYTPHDSDRVLADFEGDDFGGWVANGDAFGRAPERHGATRNKIEEPVGSGLINSFQPNDRPTGTLTSPPFTIDRKHLNVLIGGGNHPGKTGLSLLVDDQELRQASGWSEKNQQGEEVLRWRSWDLSDLKGKEARLRIFDQHEGGWGHIVVDHILLSDRNLAGEAPVNSANFVPPPRPGVALKDEWSTFPLYDAVGYDQALRPQFHFTSRMGWLNDPNGMVHYDGEWHMFFQHYAKGNSNGPKSWGTAKSPDLMRWTQYDHVFNPYPNVKLKNGNLHAIWSGSAVVDELNSLGKQTGDTKTIFATFTATHANAEGKNEFFQVGAYSTDRGRTFTMLHDGKPMIDHIHGRDPGQRDPRVFFHEPTQSYILIMEIGGKDRDVRLWRSKDLLNWESFLDIPHKAAECIDMYHVALDGDPNNRKWVIADAGTHYEVGDFDGETWTGFGDKEKANKRLRFDFGDAYYAAQAFNQAPGDRVVHIGWLTSKQAGYRPFLEAGMPFTQQMSIPAEITLRTTPDGIRMFRNPVKEIESLYTKTTSLGPGPVPAINRKLAALSTELLDLTLTFAPTGDLTLDVRGLPIHYKHAKQEFQFTNTDRVEAERAAWPKDGKRAPYRDTGLRTIPAPAVDGKVTLRALVDRASLELFINDGQAAASFVVAPDPEDREIAIIAPDDFAIESLVINELESAWGTPLAKGAQSSAPKPEPKKPAPSAPSGPPSREIEITGKHLLLPIAPRKTPDGKDHIGNSFRIMVEGVLVHQFWANVARREEDIEFWSYLDMSEFIGETATVMLVRGSHEGAEQALQFFESSDEIRSLKPLYTETGRPQFHFSQKVGWNNDPNGMVYHDGLWHLAWQSNPFGLNWGNMYWGHAVSRDLVHWEERPHMLRIGGAVIRDGPIHPAMALGQAFSGGATVDVPNTLGLQKGDTKTLIAAYTSNPQGECLAYSTDGGRSYRHLNDHQPVIVQPHPTDPEWKKSWGRDPKLIWHEPTKKWIIVTYRMGSDSKKAIGRMAFYSSPDLKNWKEESLSEAVFHECPDLVELPIDGDPNNKKWLLFDATPKYQIGTFDGQKFSSDFEGTRQTIGGTLKAAQCFSNAPDGRAICMVWSRVKPQDPRAPFNQGFTLPLELSLRTATDGVRCYANPVAELEALRLGELASIQDQPVDGETRIPLKSPETLLEIELTLRFKDGAQPDRVTLQIGKNTVSYDLASKSFPEGRLTSFDPDDGKLDLRIFADSATIEVFGENGAVYYLLQRTVQGESIKDLAIKLDGGSATIENLKVHQLKSIWK